MSATTNSTASQAETVAGAQAVTRALAVLTHLSQAGTDVGVTEIANALSLTPSTVHRLVRALVADGFVAQNEATERYYLGRAAVLLGQAAQRNLGLDLALPVLERLGADTGESVNLVVREDASGVVVLHIASRMPLRFEQPPGSRIALHGSSTGKALLAFADDWATTVQRLPTPLAQLTPKTLYRAADLRRDLREIRTRGYSIDDEESIAGVRCVGAPVLNDGSARAAIAVQAPAVRMPYQRIHELGPVVIAAAREVARLLPPHHRL